MKTIKVQLNLYVPEHYRDVLQKMAAERMLKNPRKSVTASRIGAEIIGEYLNRLDSNKERGKSNGNDHRD